jgi:hypothetical protein
MKSIRPVGFVSFVLCASLSSSSTIAASAPPRAIAATGAAISGTDPATFRANVLRLIDTSTGVAHRYGLPPFMVEELGRARTRVA